MLIVSDSRDPIFNSRDPNRVPKTPLKNLTTHIIKVNPKLNSFTPKSKVTDKQ